MMSVVIGLFLIPPGGLNMVLGFRVNLPEDIPLSIY
jgi:hypothetical protein